MTVLPLGMYEARFFNWEKIEHSLLKCIFGLALDKVIYSVMLYISNTEFGFEKICCENLFGGRQC